MRLYQVKVYSTTPGGKSLDSVNNIVHSDLEDSVCFKNLFDSLQNRKDSGNINNFSIREINQTANNISSVIEHMSLHMFSKFIKLLMEEYESEKR